MPVRANATAVRQILLNLLTNALKFTPPGGEVRVVTGYLDDGAVYLVVRDTGDGMSDEALAHAFNDDTETNDDHGPAAGAALACGWSAASLLKTAQNSRSIRRRAAAPSCCWRSPKTWLATR